MDEELDPKVNSDLRIVELLDFIRSNKICIFLEGSISAGKSTLCKSIQYLMDKYSINYKYYPEPINRALLNLFYSNIDKYAFTFQTVIIRDRVHIMEGGLDYLRHEGNLIAIDRSILGDCAFALMLYKDEKITNEEFVVYADLTKPRKGIEFEGIKNVVVYLNCSPNKNRERVIIRGEPTEMKSCTLEYLQELDKSYKKVMSLQNCNSSEINVINQVYESIGTRNVISVDYDKDFTIINDLLTEEDTFDILQNIVNQIKRL